MGGGGFGGGVCRVHVVGGAKLKFGDGLRDVENLGKAIVQATTQRLTPRAIAAYNSGMPVPFGSYSVSQQGISRGQKVLTWDQYDTYELKEGMVRVKMKGKFFNWATIPVRTMPNMLVFLSLVDY